MIVVAAGESLERCCQDVAAGLDSAAVVSTLSAPGDLSSSAAADRAAAAAADVADIVSDAALLHCCQSQLELNVASPARSLDRPSTTPISTLTNSASDRCYCHT